MYCTTCGTALRPGDRFCSTCGAPAAALPQTVFVVPTRFIESLYPPDLLVTAGPGRRLVGYLLDVLLSLLTLGIGWLVWFIIVAPGGQTPAKQLLRMYIMRADGTRAGGVYTWVRQFLVRGLLGFALNLFTLGVYGLLASLWCIWDRDHQCLWDKIAGTYIAYSPNGYRPATAAELRRRGLPRPIHARTPFAAPFTPPTTVTGPAVTQQAWQGSQPAGAPPAAGARYHSEKSSLQEQPMSTQSPHQEPFRRLTPQEAKALIDRGGVEFIDVREPHEYERGHAKGARLVPLNSLFTNPDQIPANKPVVFICQVGQRSALAAEFAAAIGRTELYNVEGGTDAWQAAGLPVE